MTQKYKPTTILSWLPKPQNLGPSKLTNLTVLHQCSLIEQSVM